MRVTLAAASASALLLSGLLGGCGVAATQFHPGLAAEVGDKNVTTKDVDDSAAAYCQYLIDSGATDQQPVAIKVLRRNIATELAEVEAARQVASDHDVQTGQNYQQSLASLKGDPGVTKLSDDQHSRVDALNSAEPYVSDIVLALGRQALTAQGTSIPTDATKANAAALPVGIKVLGAWIADHVQIDPRYDVQINPADLGPAPLDEGVSYADSRQAKAGLALGRSNSDADEKADAAAARLLPPDQRCGGGSGTATTGSPAPQ